MCGQELIFGARFNLQVEAFELKVAWEPFGIHLEPSGVLLWSPGAPSSLQCCTRGALEFSIGALRHQTRHVFFSKTANNHINQLKNHPRNAPTAKSYKKAPSGRSQTSEIDNPYNTFSCFPKGPDRALKVKPKWKPKWGPQAAKIMKNLEHEHLQKH